MDDSSHLHVWVERSLIAAVYTLSAALTVFTNNKKKLESRRRRTLTVFHGVASSCLIIGFIGLILYLAGKLSIDAFGVLIIGTLPGLEASHRIQLALSFIRIHRKPALHNKIQDFSYLRYGRPPEPEIQQRLGVSYDTDTYLRLPKCAKATPMNPEVMLRNAAIVSFDENVVILKDFEDSDAVIWWKAANKAMDCFKNPSAVGFDEVEQVFGALELVAEIAMIGDVVFRYHGRSLQNHVKHSRSLEAAISLKPARVYSSFLGKVGLLQEWGAVDAAKMASFQTDDFRGLTRGERYGMLFFILLMESKLFSRKREGTRRVFTAVNVIQAFTEAGTKAVRSFVTRSWLTSYSELPEQLFMHDDIELEGLVMGLGKADLCRDDKSAARGNVEHRNTGGMAETFIDIDAISGAD